MANLAKITTLKCACCGAWTMGRQWWNQDTGYGLCPKCGEWIAARKIPGISQEDQPEYMRQTYGTKGVHYSIEGATS